MKYAFLFFVFSLVASAVLANEINSFSDSQALVTLSEFMIDASSDMQVSSRISDKKLKLKDTQACTDVSAAAVSEEVQNALKTIFRFYPDEELPVDEALNDLSLYLANHSYKKCIVYQKNSYELIKSVYFFDLSDKKHVKVDTITLLTE